MMRGCDTIACWGRAEVAGAVTGDSGRSTELKWPEPSVVVVIEDDEVRDEHGLCVTSALYGRGGRHCFDHECVDSDRDSPSAIGGRNGGRRQSLMKEPCEEA